MLNYFMLEVNVKEWELCCISDLYLWLPSFDLSLSDSSTTVLGEAQAQHSEEDVERVGRVVELRVSRRMEGRGGAAAAGLL